MKNIQRLRKVTPEAYWKAKFDQSEADYSKVCKNLSRCLNRGLWMMGEIERLTKANYNLARLLSDIAADSHFHYGRSDIRTRIHAALDSNKPNVNIQQQ